MSRNLIIGAIASHLTLTAAGAIPEAAGRSSAPAPPVDKPNGNAKVELLADVSAVAPGRPFQVGVNFRVEPKWHIYWRYSGDTGRPTEVKWSLPPGFKHGVLRYPAPRKFVDAGDTLSFGYEGQVLLWTTVTPPKTLEPGGTVRLSAEVEWLACKTLCVIGKKTVALALPVAASADRVAPAHKDLFQTARRRTPVPPASAQHVRIEVGLNVDQVRPGDRFEAGVRLTIEPGWHVQSHKPLDKNFIATDLFLGSPDVIRLGPPVFPPGKTRARLGQKVSEYGGQVLIRVPARATADLKPGRLHVDGVLVFQPCSDAGACLPPQYVDVNIPIKTAPRDAAAKPANTEWFAGSTAQKPSAPGAKPHQESRPAGVSETPGTRDGETHYGLAYLLALAFLAGLILNVMPCVLPVVSIKVLSFVQQAGEEPRRVLQLGSAFTAGMLLFFVGLGLLAMAVPVGPGFVLQRPVGVIAVTVVIFAFALSLFGVFELTLPGRAAASLQAAGGHEGAMGAFAKGFLATILGTSCTAPVLSGVWMSALAAGAPIRLLVFTTMGLGMASPYMILAAKPGWMRFLPRPGAWMETFKQFMGFVMLATALWLLWVLAGQVGGDGLVWALVFLTILSVGLWLVGRIPPTAGSTRWLVTHAVAALLILAGGWMAWPGMTTRLPDRLADASTVELSATTLDYSRSIPWQPYAPGRAEQLAAKGHIVYVDYTARWCVTCQSNKRLVLETRAVRAAMKRLGVIPLKADFSNGSPDIERDLDRFGRKGVPLNLVYAPGLDEPIVLPEVFVTNEPVLRALQRAEAAAKDAARPSGPRTGTAGASAVLGP